MAKYIELNNGRISALIAPYNGGMLTSLKKDGTEILSLDKNSLDVAPMLSGGIPLLFPFASRTENDTYVYNNKEYAMPFHGLIKNSAFGIKNVTSDEAVLYIENNELWKECFYPFDFYLELKYTLTENGIILDACLENRGEVPLYHSFGFHPFFKATDKTEVRLFHSCKREYDYINGKDIAFAPVDMDLSKPWDNVFHTPSKNGFTFENRKDGYSVIAEACDELPVLVVCTTLKGAVCVEPWCGIPNTANSHRFEQTVLPFQKKNYIMELKINTIK